MNEIERIILDIVLAVVAMGIIIPIMAKLKEIIRNVEDKNHKRL